MLMSTIRLAVSGITSVTMLCGAVAYRGDGWLKLYLLLNSAGTGVITLITAGEEEKELQIQYDREDIETQARINKLTKELVYPEEPKADDELALWLAINQLRSKGATESEVLPLLHKDKDLARMRREALDKKYGSAN